MPHLELDGGLPPSNCVCTEPGSQGMSSDCSKDDSKAAKDRADHDKASVGHGFDQSAQSLRTTTASDEHRCNLMLLRRTEKKWLFLNLKGARGSQRDWRKRPQGRPRSTLNEPNLGIRHRSKNREADDLPDKEQSGDTNTDHIVKLGLGEVQRTCSRTLVPHQLK